MKIAEDAYKINGNGNVYVILSPTPTIIDSGNYEDSEYIKSEIIKIIPLEKIRVVLLTHLHYDHAGNIDIFPNAKIYANGDEIKDCKKKPEIFFFNKISKKVKDIVDKKILPLPDKISELEVINVPGHTRGSVAFLDKKRKLLFSGDTIFSNGIGRTDFDNSVPEKMHDSVEKLKKEIIKGNLKLCAGHDY